MPTPAKRAIKRLARLVDDGGVVFFGGAGVSTESNIPDFRSEAGLYAAREVYGYPPETLLSAGMLERDPERFFAYHAENLVYPEAEPNAAHRALAALEARGLVDAVITQNIDGLHQRAGSRNVLELHGSTWRHYCLGCDARYTLPWVMDPAHLKPGTHVPVCADCGAMVRPDVVLYGESLDHEVLVAAVNALAAARTVVVAGTSLAVYPAAGLLDYATGPVVLINMSATPLDESADLVITRPVGQVFGEVMDLLNLPLTERSGSSASR